MNTFANWQQALTTSWSQVWASFLSFVPQFLGALVIFIIGLLIASWLRSLVENLLKSIKVDNFSKKVGIEDYLKKAEIKTTFAEILAVLVQWLIIVTFFLAAIDILGLAVVSQVLVGVLAYIPNIFAAVLIFAAGYLIAGVVDALVRGALASIDHEIAKPVGKLSRWLVVVISFFAALDQLQIAQTLIATFFQGLTYTIVLVVGLSVGLGAKDVVSDVLKTWYQKIKK